MAKLTVSLAFALLVLGLAGYVGTGSQHPTALIPCIFGVLLGIFGFLSFSPDPGRRKLFMHINVTIALLGFLGTAGEIVRGLVSGKSLDPVAAADKDILAAALLLYVVLCVRSFLAARRAGRV